MTFLTTLMIMKKSLKSVAVIALVAVFSFSFLPDAKAWKLFGREKTTIEGMDCVQDPSGAWGRYYTQKTYIFGIGFGSDDARFEENPSCG